jgi:hypothetical protein
VTLPWGAVQADLFGVSFVQHAIVTFNGTWGAGLVQYPGNVVNGLAEYVNADLCYEVPCPYPASFGPIGGNTSAPSYQQSIQIAYDWFVAWQAVNPNQTFGLIGYSQGAEAASRILIDLMNGTIPGIENFIGGLTYGNPCRPAGKVAPGIVNPGAQWRGIASVQIPQYPTINGQVVWADFVHSKANGDAGNDMYTMVPNTQVGTIMTDVYITATQAQLNSFGSFLGSMVTDLEKLVEDSGLLSGLKGGLASLVEMGAGAGIAFLTDLIGGVDINATGAKADVAAAVLGLNFLTAKGGSTGPHISYLGEIPGYSNLVANGVNFLGNICTLTPARV